MLQETVQRFPMSCAMRFFGSDWHGVADGLILNVGLTLFMITGCPFSCDRFPFPDDLLCKQPMARCPAWPQIKQWGQPMVPLVIQSWHLPFLSTDSSCGRLNEVLGPPDCMHSAVLSTRVMCLVREDTCAVSCLIASRLASNSASTRVGVFMSVCPLPSCWATLTVTGRDLDTTPRRFNLPSSSVMDLVICSNRKSSLICWSARNVLMSCLT